MLVAGIIVFRTVLVGGHVNYVRSGLSVLLLLAAAVVVVVALASLWTSVSPGGAGHGPRVGWLMLVPMLALISIPQVPLGAFAVGLGSDRASFVRPSLELPPLPTPRDGAVDLSMSDFIARTLFDPDSIEGVPVRLRGFVAPDLQAPSGYLLSRFRIGCCAADAQAMQVVVVNDVPRDADTWLEVVGVARPVPDESGGRPKPELHVVQAHPIPAPDDPYEY
jgi:uncharacterized repeat protein (TIGR03943 family)